MLRVQGILTEARTILLEVPTAPLARCALVIVGACQPVFLRLLRSTTVARWAFIRSAMLRPLSREACA